MSEAERSQKQDTEVEEPKASEESKGVVEENKTEEETTTEV